MTVTTSCPDAARLKELLDGVLPESEQAALAGHLDTCVNCQHTLEGLAAEGASGFAAAWHVNRAEQAPESALQQAMEELRGEGSRTGAAGAAAAGDEWSLAFLSPPVRPGDLGRLGQYDVIDVIGRGGMGVVLKAFDTTLHRFVAIKVLAPPLATSAAARKRFTREAQAAAAVTHEHVVSIHAVDTSGELPYIVMQYVPGLSLQERIDRTGPLEVKQILRIGLQTASGLAAAHAQGLIHRDIKPANILLENGVERVKLTDFGLARAVDDASISQSGVVAGTPQYMAPEQTRAEALDHRADLFSLGSVLYAMCTGRPPFRAETTMAMLRRVSDETPRPIREINPDIPDWLVAIVEKLHAKNPAERFQTAAEVAELLGQHLAQLQQPSVVPLPTTKHTKYTKHTAHSSSRLVAPPSRLAATAGNVARTRRWAMAAAVLLLVAGGLAVTEVTGQTKIAQMVATVLRIRTPDGTLVVEIDDPQVKVSVDTDGEEITITGAGAHSISLRPGKHQLRATKDGMPVQNEMITITRGGKQVVRVSLEGVGAMAGKPTATTDANQPAGQPFVILPREAKPERKFATLAEAVEAAQSSDIIEIRGNGPFVTQPISIANKPLIIRAGEGFRPTIQLDPEVIRTGLKDREIPNFPVPLLKTKAHLVLEGIEIQRLSPEGFKRSSFQAAIVSWRAPLQLANCRFLIDPDCEAVWGDASPVFDIRNCEFFGTGIFGRVDWVADPGGRMVLDNCLLVGGAMGIVLHYRGDHIRDVSVQLRRNTVVAQNPVGVMLEGMPKSMEIENPRPIELVTRENVLDGQSSVLVLNDGRRNFNSQVKQLSAQDFKSILPCLMQWREEAGNVYSLPDLQNFVNLTPIGQTMVTSPQEWIGFWKSPMLNANSRKAKVHYQGIDPPAELGPIIRKLSKEDFRLLTKFPRLKTDAQTFSPGVDIDLLGPGAAYERWKKTPEHQEWLKKIGQMKDEQKSGPVPPKPASLARVAQPSSQPGQTQLAPNAELEGEPITFGPTPVSLQGLPVGILSMAYSPDGNLLAAGGGGNTTKGELRLWDLATSQLRYSVRETKGIRSVAFSPDGKLLATGEYDGTAKLRDPATGKVIRVLQKYSSGVSAVAFSPDGKTLAAAVENTVDLWDVTSSGEPGASATGVSTPRATLRGHTGKIFFVAFAPDGKTLATAGGLDKIARLWDLATSKERAILQGHTNAVECVAFAPDGKTVATASWDNTVKLWETDTGKEKTALPAHSDYVIAVAFSPDGKTLATGSRNRTVKFWDMATLQEQATFQAHDKAVYSVLFSRDSKRLATGGQDPTAKIWDVASRKELSRLRSQEPTLESAILAAAYSPDGKTMAVANEDKTVQIRDLPTGEVHLVLKGHDEVVTCLAFSPDGKTLATGSPDKTVKLWDLTNSGEPGASATGVLTPRVTLTGHTNWVYAVAFSPDGKTLASGGYDKMVKLWDPATGKEQSTLTGHKASVRAIAFSPDGKTLATGSSDRTIKLWDVATLKERTMLKGHESTIRAVAFSPDSNTLATASEDSSIKLWDVAAGTERAILKGHTNEVWSLAFSPQGKTLATGSLDMTVKLWNPATGQLRSTLKGHTDGITAVAFAPDGRHFITGSQDKTLKIWESAPSVLQTVVTLPGHGQRAWGVAFSPDGKILATVSGDDRSGELRLWDLTSGKERAALKEAQIIRCVAFSPDGTTVATGSFDNTVQLRDPNTGQVKQLLRGHTGGVNSLAFSPDGKSLASGSLDKTVRLWDLEAGKELATLPGHTDWVLAVAFSPDGKTVASASKDRTIKLWDVSSRKERMTLLGHSSGVECVAFSPDGKSLATGSWDYSLRLWDLTTGQERRRYQSSLAGVMTIAFSPNGETLAMASGDTNRQGPGGIMLWQVSTGKQKAVFRRDKTAFWSVAFSPDGKTLASTEEDGSVKLWQVPAAKPPAVTTK